MADIIGNIEYKLDYSSTMPTVQSVEDISTSMSIPNQTWKGYYNQDVFNSTMNKPSIMPYYNFGVSPCYYGCAVACCIGAYNLLRPMQTRKTWYDAYKDKMFNWDESIVDKHGRKCGAMSTIWSAYRRWGIGINSGGLRYDYDRAYPWCSPNSRTKSPSDTPIGTYYQPTTSDTDIYRTTYNQGHGANASGSQSELFGQAKFIDSQLVALNRIESEISQKHPCIIFINSFKNRAGHYVIATEYEHKHGSNNYSTDDITVLDPCPVRGNNVTPKDYYGGATTLSKAMNRIGADISDGIRGIYVCSNL